MMASGGFGSREQDAVPGSENVTAIDGATVVQPLPAMNAPQELVKQMYAGPNSALPQRLGVAGALQEDARCVTSNLITGVPKQGGMPALSQPQISPQRRFSQRQEAVIYQVLQLHKEAEDSDRMLYANQFRSNKKSRDEGLQVMLNEMLSNEVEIERLLHQQGEALAQKHEKVVTEMQVAAGEAERLHNKIVTKMQADACKEAENREVLVSRMEEEREKAARKLVKRDKRLFSAQVDALKKDEKIKYDNVINKMHEVRKEAEKGSNQKYEKLRTQVEEVRKENEEHKREIHGRKEKEKEMLQKQSNLKADVAKQYNMYISALASYNMVNQEQTSAEKVHAEDKRANLTQLEYLESQVSALKEEKITLEKEHEQSKHAMVAQLAALKVEKSTLQKEHEECMQARMNAKLESVKSQLPGEKQGVTTVGKDDRAMRLHLAQLEEDKVMLQNTLDALKGSINSEVDRGSMKLLREVAEKVLTLPEDVRACQSVHYESGYDTLLSTLEENNVDMMMSFVHAALNEAAKNWKIAQADVAKIKWSCCRNLVDAVLGRKEPASETTAPPRDIPNHALDYIPDDPENDSVMHPHKKRKRNRHHKQRNHRGFVAGR